MEDKTSQSIREELERITNGTYTGNELIFDPETGELIVKSKQAPKPSADATVLDQIAEDGFFNLNS